MRKRRVSVIMITFIEKTDFWKKRRKKYHGYADEFL